MSSASYIGLAAECWYSSYNRFVVEHSGQLLSPLASLVGETYMSCYVISTN